MDKIYFGIVKQGDVLHTGTPSGGNLGKMFVYNEHKNTYSESVSVKDYTIDEIQHDLEKGYIVNTEEFYNYMLNQQGTILIDSNMIDKNIDTEEFLKLSNNLGIQFVQTEISYQEAIKVVCDTLKKDEKMYRVYKDNIAMAFKDEHSKQTEGLDSEEIGYKQDIHEIANQAADNFLQLLIK